MARSIWHPPEIERYTGTPERRYRAFTPKQKITIWLVALLSSWLMGLGLVKLSLMLYAVLERLF